MSIAYHLWSVEDCDSCALNYFRVISRFSEQETLAQKLFRDHGVLPRAVVCHNCEKECSLSNNKLWRCTVSRVVSRTKRRSPTKINGKTTVFLETV